MTLTGSAGGLYLFAYGTLMRGGAGHKWLRGARYLGPVCTKRCYTMVSLGRWPGLVRYGRSQVFGELYRCRAALLPLLDAYEDCPTTYERSLVHLQGQRPVAVTYLLRERKTFPAIVSGRWRQGGGVKYG